MHTVRFIRSIHNVTFEQLEHAAASLGLHNARITRNEHSELWIVEAEEELEVLMDVQESSEATTEAPPSSEVTVLRSLRRV